MSAAYKPEDQNTDGITTQDLLDAVNELQLQIDLEKTPSNKKKPDDVKATESSSDQKHEKQLIGKPHSFSQHFK